MYWNIVENRGPLKTSVSRKTAFVDDSSYVNFIVGWKELAKSTKSWISLVGMSHRLKTSSNFPYRGYERTSRYCRSCSF